MKSEANDSAALCSRIADLERQLKLADDGTARLAQRCFELEQQVLALDPRQELHTGSPLLLPQLFYDSGSGFSAQESLSAPANCVDEISHEVTAVFELPVDAVKLRFDPGELPCCVTDLTLSDERLTCQPANGIALAMDRALFLQKDPNFYLEGLTRYPAGAKLVVTYHYYPLEQLAHEPLFKAVLKGLELMQNAQHDEERCRQQVAQLRAQADALAAELELSRQHSANLSGRVAGLEAERAAYESSLEGVLGSSSWKLTAPLRRFLALFHHG